MTQKKSRYSGWVENGHVGNSDWHMYITLQVQMLRLCKRNTVCIPYITGV